MFTINKRTGDFRQTQKINRESTGNTLKIEIEASDDGDPAKSETVFVTINVTDVNDNRPYFNTSLQKQTFSTVQVVSTKQTSTCFFTTANNLLRIFLKKLLLFILSFTQVIVQSV